MAAAEYFSSAPMAGQQQQQQQHSSPYELPNSHQRPPTSHPTGTPYSGSNSNSQIPQIQTHAPPAYTGQSQPNNASVHFATTPASSNNYQHSPSPSHHSPNLRPFQPQSHNSHNSSQPLPINPSRLQNSPYPYYASAGHTPPMQYNTPPYGTPPQAQHLAPYMRPHANSYPSQVSLESGFSSDPEQQRRKRKTHRRHHDDNGSSRDLDKDRSSRPRSRSTKTDKWVGAAGGGLIGDLIFPGLGTLGGAAIGWLGGREYAKDREKREDRLHEAQKDWEKKFRPHAHHNSRSRSRDRDHNSRGSSQLGERRGSHDSRRSHH